MTDSPKVDLAAIERELRRQRVEIVRLGAAHEDDRRPVELDQTRTGRLSRMDALQSQAMAVEVERRREVELARIDAAIERLKEGEYGWCIKCGEPIAQRRLELDPATPTCIDCAAQAG